MTALRLATRRSPLALAQSTLVADALRATGAEIELVTVESAGDRSAEPLTTIGGTGVFVTAVREAVLTGQADLAVHSLKDLPTAPHPELTLAAVPPRDDPRDALVSRTGGLLADLPPGARVGTGSPRRAAQLRSRRADLQVVDVRGNVDTRLALVTDGVVDAVLLAMAGLRRLGRADRVSQVLAADVVMPAPGQGALAVETRAADPGITQVVAALDDAPTRAAVTAERALLAALEAGCTAPVGALATTVADQIFLAAVVCDAQGGSALTTSVTGSSRDPGRVGGAAAEQLLTAGAAALVGGVVR